MAGQTEGYDFASLPILDEGILLEGLRHRYERDSIYVSILCARYVTMTTSRYNSHTLETFC